jgi:hypothetical protein
MDIWELVNKSKTTLIQNTEHNVKEGAWVWVLQDNKGKFLYCSDFIEQVEKFLTNYLTLPVDLEKPKFIKVI